VLRLRRRASAGDFPQEDAPLPDRRRPSGAVHCNGRRRWCARETLMTTTTTKDDRSATDAKQQRDELEQSEKNANPNQFREENEESKIVEIPPEKDKHPIGGLDPK
jgi:hypothetical protein